MKILILQSPYRRVTLFDIGHLALESRDDFLLTLWELALVERLLGMSQSGKLGLKIHNAVVYRQPPISQE
jgi:hypothetical protein